MFKLSYAVNGIPEELIEDINYFNISELNELILF